jgi:hypothetical protein
VITEWFIQIGVTVAGWFVGLFPESGPPEFIRDFDGMFNTLTTGGSGLGAWIDWAFIIPVVLATLTVYAITFAVKLVLKVAAFIPLFGGSG